MPNNPTNFYETDLQNLNNQSVSPQLFIPTRNINSTQTTTTRPPPVNTYPQVTSLSTLSNGVSTINSGILDFSIFNSYIHYVNTGGTAIEINPSGQIVAAPYRFNIYSAQYR